MDSDISIVEVVLPDGTKARARVENLGGEEEVLAKALKFDDVERVISGISAVVVKGLHGIRPTKVVVQFSLELAVESGGLTALIARGSSKASLTVSVELEPKLKPDGV